MQDRPVRILVVEGTEEIAEWYRNQSNGFIVDVVPSMMDAAIFLNKVNISEVISIVINIHGSKHAVQMNLSTLTRVHAFARSLPITLVDFNACDAPEDECLLRKCLQDDGFARPYCYRMLEMSSPPEDLIRHIVHNAYDAYARDLVHAVRERKDTGRRRDSSWVHRIVDVLLPVGQV